MRDEQDCHVEKTSSGSHIERQCHDRLLDDTFAPGAGDLKSPQKDSSRGLDFLHGFSLRFDDKSDRGISDFAGPEKRSEWVAKPENRHPTDMSSIWGRGSRVLAIGDQHPTMSIKTWTRENMESLAKDSGASAFAMEFLPESVQSQLDEYASLRRNGPSEARDNVRRQLLETILSQQRSPEAKNDEMDKPLSYQMDLVDAAIDAGMRPLAIEPDVQGMWAAGSGFDLMQKGIAKLPASAQQAFDDFNSENSTPEKHNAAQAI
jgi:hypothetical protein